MEIILQKQKTVTLNEIQIEAVRDLFLQKRIVARVRGLERPITLWQGEEEYNSAGNWTEESVVERVKEVLSLDEIPWAF